MFTFTRSVSPPIFLHSTDSPKNCSFLAVTLLLPFVAALQLNTPTSVAAGGQVTVTWTTAAGDRKSNRAKYWLLPILTHMHVGSGSSRVLTATSRCTV